MALDQIQNTSFLEIPSDNAIPQKDEVLKSLCKLLEIIVSNQDEKLTCLVDELNQYMIDHNVGNTFWKALDVVLSKQKLDSAKVQNILTTLETVIPTAKGERAADCQDKSVSKQKTKKYVQKLWERLSITDVLPITRQNMLHILLERLMFRMEKPIFLTDYFMASLNYGGPISILGLQGIFLLIQTYNINYPQVYEKLYDMLKPNVFGMHYKARLFFLTDVFLSSIHLPECLVAGFAKRLARLILTAPPADILLLLALITNLIIRHSGLKKLITNMGKHHYENDPYISDEKDPSASMALESSLWEIKVIQHHVLPTVSSAAMFIEKPIPSVEHNLSDLLEGETSQIFLKEIKKKSNDPPITFGKTSLYHDKGFSLWSLS